jgi:hypothetical protein
MAPHKQDVVLGVINSQNLSELSSDQKIDKVVHVYNYSNLLAKDGRRLWLTNSSAN